MSDEQWPRVRVWLWTDARGALNCALHPVDGVRARRVELPQSPEMILELLKRVRGAARAATGIADAEKARIELQRQVNAERDLEQSTPVPEPGWRNAPSPVVPIFREPRKSIRTVSGGLPTLGRRSR